ncbi:MAG: Uma2 family endonuclease [Cyanobacteria bacterium J06642_2]
MVSASPLISQPAPQPVGERRVVLRSLDWQGFQTLRNVLSGDRHTRLTYFREILELTTPLEIHEFSGRLIELFVRILVGELGMDLKTMGSTTLEREDLVRSAEPDNAYYIQNHYLVADRNIDLEKDPPPDLVVEVDITHTDIDKLSLYAGIGVPEFWRYDGDVWRIYQLEKAVYREVESSPTFPRTPKSKLYEFLATARQSEMKAERNATDTRA